MNSLIKSLMIEAGYAAPELAGRAQLLVRLVLRECTRISDETEEKERWSFMGDDVPPSLILSAINKAFK